ncbi:protocadherin alpha-11 [Patella vulgata]|uniref:protocadherin alpha-11 n=1 Tax=Patella vulgata TaxID=6465 RepID=UPI00217FE8F9|nr:protocadherin alpha-11 [Patella vulgata]
MMYSILLPTALLLLIQNVHSQCRFLRLSPNSANLVVTETVSRPLASIKCSSNGTAATDVAAESYYCNVDVTSTSQTGLFTTARDSNTLLLDTVGDWRVIFNSASSFNLQSVVGTQYRVRITCRDATDIFSSQSVFQFLFVTITPNLPPTIFNSPGAEVNMDAKATGKGVVFYTLTVDDSENDFISYSLSTEPSVNYFDLDTSNGEIRTAVDLRTATQTPIFVRVNVTDGYNTVGPFSITVRLSNLNTRPDIVNLPTSVEIREDAVGGVIVSALTVSDPDVFSTSQSALTPVCSVSPLSGQSKFDQKGNVIRTTSFTPEQDIFDFEETRSYNISCSVTDGFLSSVNEWILVNISNVNEPPVFNEIIYYCNLVESKAGDSSCDLGFNIRDPESNAYSITLLPGNNSNRFALSNSNNNNNGFLNSNQRLTFNIDYDVDEAQLPTSVLLTVAAIDTIGATGTARISISIADANDNSPTFSTVLASLDVDYNTKIGIVGAITATDKDRGTNGEIDYTLLDVIPPNYVTYVFALGNGEIQYAKQYDDTIAGSSAFLTIRAVDRGSPRRSSTGTIAVSFLATTTTSTTMTTTPTTTTPTTTTTVATTTTTEYNFFAHPENIVLFSAFLIAMIIALLVALFFCVRLTTLGYCCSPSEGNDKPSDDYEYYSREGSMAYDDGYRGKSDYFDNQFSRGGMAPNRNLGQTGRPLPAIR